MTQLSRRMTFVIMLAALVALHASAARAGTLEQVPADRVCMVNDTRFPNAQIPVPVDGKTYFGCCEMCKGKLANEPSSRAAKDPISGKTVDKAAAVIGMDASGAVQYFENEKNFETYASR